MADSPTPAWLTAPEIERAIRLLPGFADATLTAWMGQSLNGGSGALGVWRLCGLAMTAGVSRSWSIVLKGWMRQEIDGPPSAWDWPHREMELYRSGLLADLPGGIRAPRCFGDIEREDGSVWVWLEDITDGIQAPWPVDRYGTLARQLGQFNGASLVENRVAETPILSRNWMRDWVGLSRPAIEAFLADADLARRAGVYPDDVMDVFGRLWNQRDAVYDAMTRLPHVFSHLDAFSRNIFVRQPPDGPEETFLIDWSYAGIAAIGEELVPLVGASVSFMDAPVSDLADMTETALEGYISGLRDAGWRGDTAAMRSLLPAMMALRYGIGPMRFILFSVLDPAGAARIEAMIGRPIDEVTDNMAAYNTLLAQQVRDMGERIAAA